MNGIHRFAIAAGLGLSLVLAAAAAAAGPDTLDVDALHRGYGPGDEPTEMQVRITTDVMSVDVAATVEGLREVDGERDGKPAKVWSATLHMSSPFEGAPAMSMQLREFIGLDGRRLGSITMDDRITKETIIVTTHALPTQARAGEQGLMYEGTETTRQQDGTIDAQFFNESWRIPADVDGDVRLQFVRRDTDSSGNVTNELVTDFGLTADGRLRMLSARAAELVGPRLEMVFTPKASTGTSRQAPQPAPLRPASGTRTPSAPGR
jgi:hypothetical protein